MGFFARVGKVNVYSKKKAQKYPAFLSKAWFKVSLNQCDN
jgi:hypothetical protein